MKKLCIFFCLLSFAVFGGGYRITVDALDIDDEPPRAIVTLKLSNHTTWKCLCSPESGVAVKDVTKKLKVGDEVAFYRSKGSERGIGRPDSKEHVYFRMTKKSKASLPKFTRYEKVEAKQKGWFSPPKYEGRIHLSDGSIWREDLLYKIPSLCKYWKKGSAVMYCGQNANDECIFRNLDQKYIGRVCCTSLKNKK